MNDMNELENALENCLQQMNGGRASLEQCLRQYPGQAAELRPLLVAAVGLRKAREMRPSRQYKVRSRSKLMDYWQAHPKRRSFFAPMAMRLSVGIAMALAVLVLAGTAYAQNAMPGETFYQWKVTSEQAWRAVAPNPVAVDLTIADRRAEELTILVQKRSQADEEAQALADYHAILQQLQSDSNPQDIGQIMQTLEAHKQKFQQAGIDVPQLDAILHGNGNNGDNGGGGNQGGGNQGGGGKP